MAFGHGAGLEEQIARWRAYLLHQATHNVDVVELESHLRDHLTALEDAGLADDEAFLVAVKRMGNLDALSRESALNYSKWLCRQLVMAPTSAETPDNAARTEAVVVVGLAMIAALAVKVPALFGLQFDEAEGFFMRNLSFFVLPLLTAYFAWKRRLRPVSYCWLVLPFVVAVAFANAFPFMPASTTEVLTALHLPMALWLVVGIAYAGGQWRHGGRRMDFVRFSGELFIYYTLIALGGGVLMGFTLGMFAAIGLDVEWFVEGWLLPCGALGAVIVSAGLVEAKQSFLENMASVLTRLFTPLFAAVLLTFLVTMVWTNRGIDVEREALIAFDLLLVLVLGLLLYGISARDPQARPNAFDALQLLLVVAALGIDVVALAAIAVRISEFGFSPNKVAALGENLILLVNLAWSAWLYARFLRSRGSFAALEHWQTSYLPVYAVWAALVVVVFPPLFGYV